MTELLDGDMARVTLDGVKNEVSRRPERKASVMNPPRLRLRKLDVKNGRGDFSHGSGDRIVDWLFGEQSPRIC